MGRVEVLADKVDGAVLVASCLVAPIHASSFFAPISGIYGLRASPRLSCTAIWVFQTVTSPPTQALRSGRYDHSFPLALPPQPVLLLRPITNLGPLIRVYDVLSREHRSNVPLVVAETYMLKYLVRLDVPVLARPLGIQTQGSRKEA